MIKVMKKDGTLEKFTHSKIERAVNKTALRCNVDLIEPELKSIAVAVERELMPVTEGGVRFVPVAKIHETVIEILNKFKPELSKEYESFRNYKKNVKEHFEQMILDTEQLLHNGDKENANRDSYLIDAQKSMSGEIFSVRNMLDYELPKSASKAHKDGDIYIHDLRDRLFNSINCCLFDMGNVLRGGFTYNGVTYKEPNSFRTACSMLEDVMNSARLNQYGGFTIPEIDSVLAPYARKTYISYYEKFIAMEIDNPERIAEEMTYADIVQGLESIEHSLHMVNNTFITFTFGLDTTTFGKLITKALLQVRRAGLGTTGVPAVFPKLVFLYTDKLHGEGNESEDLFKDAIHTSAKCMYPDYLSLDEGYLGEVYHRTGKAISPMGCRAFLSEYVNPEGESVFLGRANCGAITLNLPRFALKANGDMNKFLELVNENFEEAIKVHLFTYNRMKKVKAKTNPLFFQHGGCHIRLGAEDTLEKVLDTFTWSIGYIGLEEATQAMYGKSLHEYPTFAEETLKHIKGLIEQAKKDTGLMLALYSTPAESLCYKFLEQDKAIFGEVEGVTDKAYYTNSYHCNVTAKLDVDTKMNIERKMFDIATGGRIVYNEYPHTTNMKAIIDCVRYAMSLGLYYGVNIQADTCLSCGHQAEIEGNCPKCGSYQILRINRICGYLSYTTTEQGENMVNKGKTEEIKTRVDHFN